MRQTPKEKKIAEGKRICIEIIEQMREIEGVAGIHIMAYRQEELVAEIVEESGLLPRPGRLGAPDPRALGPQRQFERQDRTGDGRLDPPGVIDERASTP